MDIEFIEQFKGARVILYTSTITFTGKVLDVYDDCTEILINGKKTYVLNKSIHAVTDLSELPTHPADEEEDKSA